MKDLFIVGAGGMGREVLNQLLDAVSVIGSQWNIKGFLDDSVEPLLGKGCSHQVVGTIQGYYPHENDELLLCVAEPKAKMELVSFLKARGSHFASFISPSAYLGRNNQLGEGVVIYGGFQMSVNVKIGNFVTVLDCKLGHDVSVDDYATISGNCNLTGYVKIGRGAFLGHSSIIAPKVKVGENAKICLGSVVVRDVRACSTVMGNPAKEIFA